MSFRVSIQLSEDTLYMSSTNQLIGHLINFFYILCGHFDEKNAGVPPVRRGRVNRQNPKVGVGCHLKII